MKKTKVLSLILAFLLVFSMLPMSVMAADGDAAQAEIPEPTDSGIAITDAEGFKAIKDDPDGIYYLANDIDFEGAEFSSYIVENFHGTLDGRGHSIYGFSFNVEDEASEELNVGVFGTVGRDDGGTGNYGADAETTIFDLEIGTAEKPVIATIGTEEAPVDLVGLNFGFLAGGSITVSTQYMGTVLVSNVKVNGELTAYATSTDAISVGGFSGKMVTEATFSECSFDGSIELNDGGKLAARNVGGIVGYYGHTTYKYPSLFVSESVNGANVTVKGDASTVTTSGIAGIVGVSEQGVKIVDCDNNGTVTAPDANTAGILGNFTQTAINHLVLIYGCSSSEGSDMYGFEPDTATQRVCVMKSTAQNTPDYTAELAASGGVYSYVRPINTVDDLKKITYESTEYPITGFYRLDSIIEAGEQDKQLVEYWCGVLDGNGKTINVDFTTNAAGLFRAVGVGKGSNLYSKSHSESAALNFSLGSNTDKVDVTASDEGAAIGLIASVGNRAYDALVYGVDVYADFEYNSTKVTYFSGFFNNVANGIIANSNFYGSVKLHESQNNAYLGGFVSYTGSSNSIRNHILNCNNYADLSAAPAATVNNSAIAIGGIAGISGNSGGGLSIHNCANYGTLSRFLETDEPTAVQASYVGSICGNASMYTTITSCANFGDISGKTCAAAVGNVDGISKIVDFRNYGTVTITSNATPLNAYVCTDASSKAMCSDLASFDRFTMNRGASVRINDVTGIRFWAKFDTDLVEYLEAKYGADAVSYGTIIAPKAIVDAAGEFTTAKLDALKAGNDAYADVTMYNDIVADKDAWFAGVEGQIAGSITGLEGLYAVNLVGRGYIKVVVDNDVVFELYADYAEGDIANNTRSVARVAANALGDYAEGSDEYKALSAILDAAKIN